jgi:orotidine-5'-phosphate decarboxylase
VSGSWEKTKFAASIKKMEKVKLVEQIRAKKSMLCVGLDSDINKLPSHLSKDMDGLLEFNKAIIESTNEYAVAYKINTAFYEQYGAKGWEIMEQTLAAIPSECFTIADAKRGDIGNTSSMYARAFFENMSFDSVTVAPYMGEDSLKPFLQFEGKWIICLGLTSNAGSNDFQSLKTGDKFLYEQVLETVSKWGDESNTMFVIGATKSEQMAKIRSDFPNHFFLVPGVGAQGGDLAEVCKNASNADGGLLINSSRGIIYADNGMNYAEVAGVKASELQQVMRDYI